MHTETFEQIHIDRNLINNSDLMREGQVVEVMFHTEKETVLFGRTSSGSGHGSDTEPGVKGDTASTNSLKPATVDTGATVKVPLFINTGDKIRVDTVPASTTNGSKNRSRTYDWRSRICKMRLLSFRNNFGIFGNVHGDCFG